MFGGQQRASYNSLWAFILLEMLILGIINRIKLKWTEKKGNPTKCPYCSSMIDIYKCTTLFAGD